MEAKLSVSGDFITLIQTKEDKEYSLKNNVTKFSAIKYKGEVVSDPIKIEQIIGVEKSSD